MQEQTTINGLDNRVTNNPRGPTHGELDQLKTWIESNWKSFDFSAFPEWHSILYIAVFDRYMTDGPGYVGKLMYVINAGSPSWCDIFVWRDDRIDHIGTHNDLCERGK